MEDQAGRTGTLTYEPTATDTDDVGAPAEAADGAGESGFDAARRSRPDLADLLEAYYRHVPDGDRPRRADDVISVVEQHLRVAAERRPGTPKLRLFNHADSVGWASTSTVIDIVNDDMPYLVDSIIGALSGAGVTAYRVLHPILAVERDASGGLLRVIGEARPGADPVGCLRESWVHVLIDRLTDAERAEAIEAALEDTLSRVGALVADNAAIIGAAAVASSELRGAPSPRSTQEVNEAADLLLWLTSGTFRFLGYRCEEAVAGGQQAVRPGGLGVWRAEFAEGSTAASDRGQDADGQLDLRQVLSPGGFSRDWLPLQVSARVLDADGRAVRVHRFLGVLTPRALSAEISGIPVLRRRLAEVFTALTATADSYTGQRALEVLTGYPRAELFWARLDQVLPVVHGALQLASRRRLRAYLQPDPARQFVSVLVHLPRDRWTTSARLAMQDALLQELHGRSISYAARIGDTPLAAVHFLVVTDPDDPLIIDDEVNDRINVALRATIRTWEDQLVQAVVGSGKPASPGTGRLTASGPDSDEFDELDTPAALAKYADAFDAGYKQDYPVADAVADLARLDALAGPHDLDLNLSALDTERGERRLKLYVTGEAVTLSRVLPVLQSLGAEVIDERPYPVRRSDGTPAHIYDFSLRWSGDRVLSPEEAEQTRMRVTDAFQAAWSGRAEVDGFNGLVLAAGLPWRPVAVLRAYAHYLRQIGVAFTQGYIEQVLQANPGITADLAALFTVRFDPEAAERDRRDDAEHEVEVRITTALDDVQSLDADRILRMYLDLIKATVRTNAFVPDRPTLVFKLLPQRVPVMPKPVPVFEIWVYSPRVEGVHLRFGPVARGGLRWSDRPEDFRTEILGLVKAQEVKNAVIVPVGAKGGFVLRQAPSDGDREAVGREGVACYRLFIASLLELTDNRVDGGVVPPAHLVRHDGDDPYLVVAADKGTATFSDIANEVALDAGFWLGDAFASGGSAGYDHKAMGITARGSWESVKHHFRELGVDIQSTDFTCVGVGDMSGDVFGNGMLCSEHTRLIAAFDHRHVFVDPDPDTAASYAERRRLFGLPRSSWADYSDELISAGGGVWPRSAKSIPVSPQMRAALALADDVVALTPVELIRAVLLTPVDLLYNGGIGTYVKSVAESNLQVGDKANDAVRVDGGDLRVKVLGEGGNLGVTQLGRIEYARAGGRCNTDAIDNSAGVDTSDHEVNIKIALQPAVAADRMTLSERDHLLALMTAEVAGLVLQDNVDQNRLLGVARAHAGPMLSVHARQIDDLVARGRLDRALEFLPSHAQIEARMNAGDGLSSPELSVLIAYVKSDLTHAMVTSPLPDEAPFAQRLIQYFPPEMRSEVTSHPLAREIVTTMTVNQLVNTAGITYTFRLAEEIGAEPVEAIRAYEVVTSVFRLGELWDRISDQDNLVAAATQNELYLDLRRLLDRAARWLLQHRPLPLDVPAEIDRYAPVLAALTPRLPDLVRGVELASIRAAAQDYIERGVPADLAEQVAFSLYLYSALDIADVALDNGPAAGAEVSQATDALVLTAELHFALTARLDVDRLLTAISALPRGDRWHALARQALRDDVYRTLRELTGAVLATTPAEKSTADRIAAWAAANEARLTRARTTITQTTSGPSDLAGLSVAASEIRTIVG